jgi:hypothetical protein
MVRQRNPDPDRNLPVIVDTVCAVTSSQGSSSHVLHRHPVHRRPPRRWTSPWRIDGDGWPECSGRTSLALSFLTRLTHAGKVCAWIDVSNSLRPESVAAAGVDLHHLLWVRCGVSQKSGAIPGFEKAFSLPEKYMIAPPTKRGLCFVAALLAATAKKLFDWSL